MPTIALAVPLLKTICFYRRTYSKKHVQDLKGGSPWRVLHLHVCVETFDRLFFPKKYTFDKKTLHTIVYIVSYKSWIDFEKGGIRTRENRRQGTVFGTMLSLSTSANMEEGNGQGGFFYIGFLFILIEKQCILSK